MDNRANIPFYPHEFIGQLTDYIETTVITKIRTVFPQQPTDSVDINLDILYRNPRLKAMYYFLPLKDNEHLPAVHSGYYEYLNSLLNSNDRLLPSLNDMSPFIKSAMNSQHTITALNSFRRHPSLNKFFQQQESVELFGAGASSNMSLLTNMFALFLKRNDKFFQILNEYKLLSSIVQILLGVLPQFDGAECALMEKDKKFDVYDMNKKIGGWDKCRKISTVKPETKLFYLLSIIESLRWPGESSFIVINNIYDFLTGKKGAFTFPIRQLPLSRLSLYINVRGIEADRLKPYLRQILREQVDVFQQLVRQFNIATFRHALSSDGNISQHCTDLVAQGMANLMSPDEIEIIKEAENKKELITTYVRDEESIPSEIIESPWGVYKRRGDSMINKQDIQRSHFYELIDNGIRLNYVDMDSSIQVRWTSNKREHRASTLSPLFLGDLLSQLRSLPWQLSLQDDREWYLRAFDEYYYNFDKVRQVDPRHMELRQHESDFYLKVFDVFHSDKSSLKVIDIGIGYGRLAKKLLDIKKYQFDLYGLDISAKMTSFVKEYIPNNQVKIHTGEMIEINDVLKKDLFDVAIMAFTTFGCYESNLQNHYTLKSAFLSLKPGGLLIIEQFNPNWNKKIELYDSTADVSNEQYYLLKTTEFVRPLETSEYTSYCGDYLYYRLTSKGKQLVRRDHYNVRLYKKAWLQNALINIGFPSAQIYFYSDFDSSKPYADNPDEEIQPQIMICVARKDDTLPPIGDNEIRKLAENLSNLLSTTHAVISINNISNILKKLEELAPSASLYQRLKKHGDFTELETDIASAYGELTAPDTKELKNIIDRIIDFISS